LWAQPWIKKTESEPSSQDVPSNVEKEETKSMGWCFRNDDFFPLFLIIFLLVPNVPLPETPIDVTDCRLNLLLHIGDMQNEVNTRLESLEGLFEGSFLYCGKFY
jgi:hypothetical protein